MTGLDTSSVRYAFALMPITASNRHSGADRKPTAHLPLLTFDANPAQLKTIWDAVNRVVAPRHNLELGDAQIVLNVPAVAVTNIQRLPHAIAACLGPRNDTNHETPIPSLMLLFANASTPQLTAQLVLGESTPSGALHRVLHRAAAVLS